MFGHANPVHGVLGTRSDLLITPDGAASVVVGSDPATLNWSLLFTRFDTGERRLVRGESVRQHPRVHLLGGDQVLLQTNGDKRGEQPS